MDGGSEEEGVNEFEWIWEWNLCFFKIFRGDCDSMWK